MVGPIIDNYFKNGKTASCPISGETLFIENAYIEEEKVFYKSANLKCAFSCCDTVDISCSGERKEI